MTVECNRRGGWRCHLCPVMRSSVVVLLHPTALLPPCAPPPPDGNINTADPEWEAPFLSDLEVVYLTWDVLYLDGRCVCHLPLLERRELLRRVVRDAPPEGVWGGWLGASWGCGPGGL